MRKTLKTFVWISSKNSASGLYNVQFVSMGHSLEANIRGGEETSRRLWKSLRKPAVERGGDGRNNAFSPPPTPIFQLIHGYFILKRRNRYSPPRCFLHRHSLLAAEGFHIYDQSLFLLIYGCRWAGVAWGGSGPTCCSSPSSSSSPSTPGSTPGTRHSSFFWCVSRVVSMFWPFNPFSYLSLPATFFYHQGLGWPWALLFIYSKVTYVIDVCFLVFNTSNIYN
jgi:hypothetical protein